MSRRGIVVDTNVLVSALLKFFGWEAFVLDLVAADRVNLFISDPVMKEYWGVLTRPRLRLDGGRVGHTLRMIAEKGNLVKPSARVMASPHEDDNRFLECAEEAEADFLVTGKKRRFPDVWKTTRVVSARELVELVQSV